MQTLNAISISTFVFLIMACDGPSSPTSGGLTESGSLTGNVKTRGSNVTIEVVRDAVSRVATVDAQGRYRIDDLVPGVYGIFASAPGYSRSSAGKTVEVTPGIDAVAEAITLTWTGIGVPTSVITGIVTDGRSRLPVEGAFVNVACDPNEIICLGRSSFTDSNGRYRIESIPPRFGFDLFIGKPGYSNQIEAGQILDPLVEQVLNIDIRTEE
jgi:hypothetical protein